MIRCFLLAVALTACATSAFALGSLQGYVTQGGQNVTTAVFQSTTKVMKSYPSATVTVYAAGTTNISTIYSDSSLTAKANPFTAGSDGYWQFYAADGDYDVRFSGTGITTPWTLSGLRIISNGSSLGSICNGSIDITSLLTTALGTGSTTVVLPSGNCLISSTVTVPTGSVIIGQGMGVTTLTAKAATNFQYMLSSSSGTGVQIRNLSIDINSSNRSGVLTTTAGGINLATCSKCEIVDINITGALGFGGLTGPAIFINTCTDLLIEHVVGATNGSLAQPSDLMYLSGTRVKASDVLCTSNTDTCVAFENCANCGVDDVHASANGSTIGISCNSASTAVCRGIYVSNVISDDWLAGTTIGGTVQLLTNLAGNLDGVYLSNIHGYRSVGGGQSIRARQVSTGRIQNLHMDNVHLYDAGNQGLLLAGCDNVFITNSYFNVSNNSPAIQLLTGCTNFNLSNSLVKTAGIAGVLADALVSGSIVGNTIDGSPGGGNNSYAIEFTGGTQLVTVGDNTLNTGTATPKGVAFTGTNTACSVTSNSVISGSVPIGSEFTGTGVRLLSPFLVPGTASQAGLGAWLDGYFIWCTDCTVAKPCAGGGAGALAKRLQGVWVCN